MKSRGLIAKSRGLIVKSRGLRVKSRGLRVKSRGLIVMIHTFDPPTDGWGSRFDPSRLAADGQDGSGPPASSSGGPLCGSGNVNHLPASCRRTGRLAADAPGSTTLLPRHIRHEKRSVRGRRHTDRTDPRETDWRHGNTGAADQLGPRRGRRTARPNRSCRGAWLNHHAASRRAHSPDSARGADHRRGRREGGCRDAWSKRTRDHHSGGHRGTGLCGNGTEPGRAAC